MTAEPGNGALVALDVGSVAHGGHCVARYDGRVVFVRHSLPGERVLARLTDAAPDAPFWRADAVEVIQASPDRVPSAWPAAGPDGVGGGELAHVSLDGQRRWKAAVVAEQLQRLARIERDVVVEAAPGDAERGGLGWRTRIELVTDARGKAGMTRHRSHEVVPLTSMPLASEAIADLGLFDRSWPADTRISVAAPGSGDRPVILVGGAVWGSHGPDNRANARTSVREEVEAAGETYRYRVAADGFWQVHRSAPTVLVSAVMAALGDVDGARVLDLYSGSGLFTAPLGRAVGRSGSVIAIEGDPRAVRDARRNVHESRHVELRHGPVERLLAAEEGGAVDAVVLDPPRVGAGRRVIGQIAERAPERVVYVACDPAALARDLSYLAGHGYRLEDLRAFDLFPMTHHVECVAVLSRVRGTD
jgi:tRNA/tmRNA/rRNA uracil-C5-methylase (TrmA/RlmC/RlmD family)